MTLITGDQVVISAGEQQCVVVIPRQGCEGIVFSTTYQRMKGQPESLFVIPADAQPLIDADRHYRYGDRYMALAAPPAR